MFDNSLFIKNRNQSSIIDKKKTTEKYLTLLMVYLVLVSKSIKKPMIINLFLTQPLNYDKAIYPTMAELRKQNKTLYKSVLSNHSAVLAQDQIVMIIELYLEVPSIYFPVTLDSRGRLYCLPDYFNYQGQELATIII